MHSHFLNPEHFMPNVPITLALQGGGTHGAFAWGAVDQLLLDNRFRIEAITATSGSKIQSIHSASRA